LNCGKDFEVVVEGDISVVVVVAKVFGISVLVSDLIAETVMVVVGVLIIQGHPRKSRWVTKC